MVLYCTYTARNSEDEEIEGKIKIEINGLETITKVSKLLCEINSKLLDLLLYFHN